MPSAFDHKRPGKDKVSHLGITECVAHSEVGHLPFNAVHETVAEMRICYFTCPVAEVCRTDRKAISFQHRGNTHGSLAAVTLAVKCYPPAIDKRLRRQPLQQLIMLRQNKREQ